MPHILPVPDTPIYHWYENYAAYQDYQYSIDGPSQITMILLSAFGIVPLLNSIRVKNWYSRCWYLVLIVLLVFGNLCWCKSEQAFTYSYTEY